MIATIVGIGEPPRGRPSAALPMAHEALFARAPTDTGVALAEVDASLAVVPPAAMVEAGRGPAATCRFAPTRDGDAWAPACSAFRRET